MDNLILFGLIINLIISMFVALFSSNTPLGMWRTFFISFFFSPIIGILAVMLYRPARMNVADELTKLKDLHDKGVLTDAEYETQKDKVLNN